VGSAQKNVMVASIPTGDAPGAGGCGAPLSAPHTRLTNDGTLSAARASKRRFDMLSAVVNEFSESFSTKGK
jgi:hypothetical protein